jgi:hypothetical protein
MNFGCCAAVRGTTSPGTAARTVVGALTPATSSTTSVSACAVSPQDCLASPEALKLSALRLFSALFRGRCHGGQHLPRSAVGFGLLAVGARAAGAPKLSWGVQPVKRTLHQAGKMFCFGSLKLCRVTPCLSHAAERNPAGIRCRNGPRKTVGCSPEPMAALIDAGLINRGVIGPIMLNRCRSECPSWREPAL